MNDDAIFLVIFFCTAAASGILSSLDETSVQAARALETRYCDGNQAGVGVRAGLCAIASRLLNQPAGASTTPPPAKSEAPAMAPHGP